MAGSGLSDPDDIRWTWLGKGRKGKKGYTYFDQAKVKRISDGEVRMFSVGDPVYVASDPDQQPWVAHLVEMFQVGEDESGPSSASDTEIQVVEDNSVARRMRCTLRWFYYPSDVSDESRRLNPVPKPIENEIYFSDHVEDNGSNGLEVIEGRAYLCSTLEEAFAVRTDPPDDYWVGDSINVVRCFYGTSAGEPPPIRELEKGELERLLKNPSTDQDLYSSSRPAMLGVHGGVVMKGTGRKRQRIQVDEPSPSRIRAEAVKAKQSSGSLGDRDVHMDDVALSTILAQKSNISRHEKTGSGHSKNLPRGKTAHMKENVSGRAPLSQSDAQTRSSAAGKSSRNRRFLDHSSDDSSETFDAGEDRIMQQEASGHSKRIHSGERKGKHGTSEKAIDSVAKARKDVQTVRPGHSGVGASSKLALHKLAITARQLSGPGRQQLYSSVEDLVDAMSRIMVEQNLSLDMSDAEGMRVAKAALRECVSNSKSVHRKPRGSDGSRQDVPTRHR